MTHKSVAAAAFVTMTCATSVDAAHSGTAVEEIVVTATRREMEVQQTPLSVSALGGVRLDADHIDDLGDLHLHVPALQYSHDGLAGYRITLRGITSGTLTEPRPLAAFYLDDTPMMTLAGSAAQIYFGGPRVQVLDLSRVEVLRGPQGTLFGTSSMGGAIRFVSHSPDVERFESGGSLDVSSVARGDEGYMAKGFINMPLPAKRVGLRLAALQRFDPGFINNIARSKNDVDGSEISAVRFGWRWDPTPTLGLELTAHGQDRTQDGMRAADVDIGRYAQRRPSAERDDETWRLYRIQLSSLHSGARVVLSSAWLQRRPRYAFDISSFIEPLIGFWNPTANTFAEEVKDRIHELRITSAAARIDWLLGAYYQHQDHTQTTGVLSPGFDARTDGLAASFGYADQLDHSALDATLEERALYGEVGFTLGSHWRAALGARWFSFEQDLGLFFDGYLNAGPSSVREASVEHGVTPRVSISYQPQPNNLYYTTLSQGYRPGGANQFTPTISSVCAADLQAVGFSGPPPPFESDTLWNIETGVKLQSSQRTWTLATAAYYIRWEDMQTFRNLPCGYGFAENAGRASSLGFELELQVRPSDRYELSLGVSNSLARIAETSTNLSAHEGERIPGVPRWNAALAAQRDWHMSGQFRGFLRATYHYASASWSDYDDTLRERVPRRSTFGFTVGLIKDTWSLNLYAENAFNDRSVMSHSKNIVGEWQVTTAPRTIGLRVEAHR